MIGEVPLVNITLSDTVNEIKDRAFDGCDRVKKLTIPASVTNITKNAFDGCEALETLVGAEDNPGYTFVGGLLLNKDGTEIACALKGLTSVTIPESVRRIKNSEFSGYAGLKDVRIGNGVTNIGYDAFYECRDLASVTMGNGVELIGSYAFYGCRSLITVTMPGTAEVRSGAFDDTPFYANQPDGPVVFGKTFYSMKGVCPSSVVIPFGVTHIGNGAFRSCNALASVSIPDGVTEIGENAFDDCRGLKHVTIPDSVTGIGECAFCNCSSLESVSMGVGVVWIGRCAFYGCTNLNAVQISDLSAWCRILFDSYWFSFESSMFWVSDYTVNPLSYAHTLRLNGSPVADLVIPADVTGIPNHAFYGYSGLKSVTIPEGVTGVGDHAFYGCSGLTRVVFKGDAPNVEESAFGNVGSNCTVYVKENSTGWGTEIPGTWNGMKIEYAVGGEDPPGGGDAPVSGPTEVGDLYAAVSGAVPGTGASTYDGYLCDARGNVKGTIQVKVGKPNARTGLAAVKATVVGLDGKKKNLKAPGDGKVAIAANGPTTVSLAGGEACEVTIGTKGLSGTYGGYAIDGALNVFTSKDAADKAAATAALGKWQGAVNVAWKGAQGWNGLSVIIAAKGKAKVSGTLANGTKVSAKGQLIVGEEWCCVPVVVSKKAQLAFNVWLPRGSAATSAAAPMVVGLGADVKVGKPGTLKGGATFRLGGALGDAKYEAYLPDGVAVGGGAKWTLPKAGKVQLTRDGQVDASKLGENPSALKLSYKSKDGTFKGSFKSYADVNGKPKAMTVKVVGVLVKGVGYGTATVKGGGAPVTIE